jgi:hypothetical protein
MKEKMRNLLIVLLFCMGFFAQSQKINTSVDSVKVKIGAQINLTLKTKIDTLSHLIFPELLNLGALEVIESKKTDTLVEGKYYILTKKYGLTQFDTGRFVVPPVKLLLNNKPIFSDSLEVRFMPVVVDTLKQNLYDIKDIEAAPTNWDFWKKIGIILLILIILGLIVFFVWKYFKNKKQTKVGEIVYKTPLEKATALLQNLEKRSLIERGEIKEYYSELADIARTYIEEAIKIPAMESTTKELIDALKKESRTLKLKLNQESIKNLENVLKQADLVKFAKSKPLDFEIAADKERISSSITKIHQAIPVEVVEEIEDPLAKEKQILAQKRKKKITYSIIAAVLVLSFTLTYFIVTQGFEYTKDKILGHYTQELLEGEWVTSDYGNPAIHLETPKVLERLDVKNLIPNEFLTLMKEFKIFGYGSLLSDYNVVVSTIITKDAAPTNGANEGETNEKPAIDLEKAITGSLNMIAQQGASNIIEKREDFSADGGITGRRAYGTMDVIDPITKSSKKCYYELIYFNQQGGLQSIMIVQNEKDKYAEQITTRIIKSIAIGQPM